MSKYYFTYNSSEGYFDCKESLICFGDETLPLRKFPKKTNRRLYIIFSKQCNLRCVYCFQKDNIKKPCRYSKEEILSIFNGSICNFDELVLYGGEPLLDSNLDAIKEIFSSQIGLPIYIFTNGNITSKARELVISNKKQVNCIVITIDGSKEIHDKLRINPNGSSFDNALSTIRLFCAEGMPVQIQINIDNRNISDVHGVMKCIEACGLFPVLVMLNPIKYSSYTLQQEQLIQLYIDLKQSYPNLDIHVNSRLIRNLYAMIQNEPIEIERCGLSNTVVADFSSGNVYACPHNEESKIGCISNNLQYEHNAIAELTSRTKYNRKECLLCEYAYLCSFGCPFVVGDFDCCKDHMDASLKVFFKNFESLFAIER